MVTKYFYKYTLYLNRIFERVFQKCIILGAEYMFYTLTPFMPTVPTCAVRETMSLGIMGASQGAPLE